MILQVQDSHHDEVNNYANVDLICKVAKAEKVDAVWPGVSGEEFQQTCLQLWLVNLSPLTHLPPRNKALLRVD